MIPFSSNKKSVKTLALWRFPGEKQELGRLTIFDGVIPIFDCVTLQKAIGLVDGTFPIEPFVSPKTGKTVLLLKDTPGHSFIEIHIGNFLSDTKGCILPGKDFTDINKDGLLDVVWSTPTMERINALVTAPTTITIKTLGK